MKSVLKAAALMLLAYMAPAWGLCRALALLGAAQGNKRRAVYPNSQRRRGWIGQVRVYRLISKALHLADKRSAPAQRTLEQAQARNSLRLGGVGQLLRPALPSPRRQVWGDRGKAHGVASRRSARTRAKRVVTRRVKTNSPTVLLGCVAIEPAS